MSHIREFEPDSMPLGTNASSTEPTQLSSSVSKLQRTRLRMNNIRIPSVSITFLPDEPLKSSWLIKANLFLFLREGKKWNRFVF